MDYDLDTETRMAMFEARQRRQRHQRDRNQRWQAAAHSMLAFLAGASALAATTFAQA